MARIEVLRLPETLLLGVDSEVLQSSGAVGQMAVLRILDANGRGVPGKSLDARGIVPTVSSKDGGRRTFRHIRHD